MLFFYLQRQNFSTALILMTGINYYPVQLFSFTNNNSMRALEFYLAIWECRSYLHDIDIDFAVWCRYKYLNCGHGYWVSIYS